MKRILIALALITGSISSFAQIDTLFWFAPPEITSGHAEDPLTLQFSTFSNAATVTISQPANPTFNGGAPIVLNIPANSFDRAVLEYYDNGDPGDCNLSVYGCPAGNQLMNVLETRPANTILNTGLLIESTADITVYYEVLGSNCDDELVWIPVGECALINTDIFSLKGNNALGTDFWVPGQTGHYTVNSDFWSTPIQGKNTADVVATEDNTQITFQLPAGVAAVGHTAGSSWSVTLNRGQTYSVQALDDVPATTTWNSLVGMRITSDKNIAVTLKDDSVTDRADQADNGGANVYDLAGDQLIPIQHAGLEYIIQGGYMYLTATQANTSFSVTTSSGTSNYNITNAGEAIEIDLRSETSSAYIVADKPVMTFHLNVIDGTDGMPEFGGAVVPQINCTGSPEVVFNRSTNEPNEKFFVNILVKTTAVDSFTFNGQTGIITADSFTVVPGTGGTWSYMFRANLTNIVTIDSTHIIGNTMEVFHLSTVNGREWEMVSGQNSTGSRYGYFSNFEQLIVSISVNDACIPVGDSIQVGVPPGFPTVEWSTMASTDSIWITSSGSYWVKVTNSIGCSDSVGFNVTVNTLPVFSLTPNQQSCTSSQLSATIDSGSTGTGATFSWTDSTMAVVSTDSILTTTNPGTYVLTVTNGCGTGTDSVTLTVQTLSVPNVFTPNGDNVNETFIVPNIAQYGEWEFEVYSRWGERVYMNPKYDNTWDGTDSDNHKLSEGVYYFLLRETTTEECPEFKGWVTILR